MCLNSGEGNFQRITGSASPRASMSLSSWNLGIMAEPNEGEAELLSETSKSSSSNDSEDVGIIEDSPMQNVHERETGESPAREKVSLFSATMGPGTENAEFVSSPVVPLSQDDRDEEKPLELDLEVGDKTRDDLQIGDKASEDVGYIGDKTSEDTGDDCDEEEPVEEEDEERAAKRQRLTTTGEEVNEMER